MKIIHDHIFKFRWYLEHSDNVDKAIAKFCKKEGIDPWELPQKSRFAHFCTRTDLSAGLIWVNSELEISTGLLVHEVFHAVTYWAECMEAPLKDSTEEMFAYYLQWLTDEAIKKFNVE